MPSSAQRATALLRARALAKQQAGVVGRRQLYRLGVTRWQVEAAIRAGRWRRTGAQTVCVHTGALDDEGLRWRAVLEVGPRAAIAGVSALLADGLRGVTEPTVHVIAPKSANPRKVKGVTVHESRRFREEDILTNGLRRTRPAVSVVHAALWARSDRQAALYVVAAVQQRLSGGGELLSAVDLVRRHPRRKLLRRLVLDAIDGAHALGELDLIHGLRKRSLPLPLSQSVRSLSGGRVYLDVDWPAWGISGEIDGSQHERPDNRVADTLRDLEVAATGRHVLRIPLLALRIAEDDVLDRLESVFRSRGWTQGGERPERGAA